MASTAINHLLIRFSNGPVFQVAFQYLKPEEIPFFNETVLIKSAACSSEFSLGR
jgi:hypothetical protein